MVDAVPARPTGQVAELGQAQAAVDDHPHGAGCRVGQHHHAVGVQDDQPGRESVDEAPDKARGQRRVGGSRRVRGRDIADPLPRGHNRTVARPGCGRTPTRQDRARRDRTRGCRTGTGRGALPVGVQPRPGDPEAGFPLARTLAHGRMVGGWQQPEGVST